MSHGIFEWLELDIQVQWHGAFSQYHKGKTYRYPKRNYKGHGSLVLRTAS